MDHMGQLQKRVEEQSFTLFLFKCVKVNWTFLQIKKKIGFWVVYLDDSY